MTNENILVGFTSYHRRQRCVQTSLCLAVICIAVLVAAAVIDETDL